MKTLLSVLQRIISFRTYRLLFLLGFSFVCTGVQAQLEPMFTQYLFNETFINPAYTGSHEDVSATFLYRNQWVGIDGAPKTQTLSIHSPLHRRRIAVGLSAMNDEIGVTHQLYISASFAYRILFPHSTLSFGVSGGFVNYEELLSQVPTTTPGDNLFLYNARKLFLPNAGFGMYYYKERFYAGISIPRLIQNNISSSQLSVVESNTVNFKLWNYYFMSGYVFDLNEEVKCKPTLMVKTVFAAPVELDIDVNFIFDDFLWLGGGYRTGDAAVGMIGLQLSKMFRIGYSYDYTLSALQSYTSGTHELTLRYDIAIHNNRVASSRYF